MNDYIEHPAYDGGTYTAHRTAWIGRGAVIERGAWIEQGARIERGAWIEQGAVIERGAWIEQGARIERGAWIEQGARIGQGAQIRQGAWIGPRSRGYCVGQVLQYVACAHWLRDGRLWVRIGCVEGEIGEVRRDLAEHCRGYEPNHATEYEQHARLWLDYAEQVVRLWTPEG